MDAGRDMDVLIAERVMGLKVDWEFDEPCAPALRDQYDEWGIVPRYSTEIGDAWSVLMHLFEHRYIRTRVYMVPGWNRHGVQWLEYRVEMKQFIDAAYHSLLSVPTWEATAPAAPLAICLAALEAYAVEVP